MLITMNKYRRIKANQGIGVFPALKVTTSQNTEVSRGQNLY